MTRMICATLLLAGCAPLAEPNSGVNVVERELAGRVAGEPKRCVPVVNQEAIRIAGPRTLHYRRGETIWVNRQERDCFGSGGLATLIVEPSGGSYCNGDHVRRLEPGSSIPGPTCLMRDWIPYRRPS